MPVADALSFQLFKSPIYVYILSVEWPLSEQSIYPGSLITERNQKKHKTNDYIIGLTKWNWTPTRYAIIRSSDWCMGRPFDPIYRQSSVETITNYLFIFHLFFGWKIITYYYSIVGMRTNTPYIHISHIYRHQCNEIQKIINDNIFMVFFLPFLFSRNWKRISVFPQMKWVNQIGNKIVDHILSSLSCCCSVFFINFSSFLHLNWNKRNVELYIY